MQRRNARARMYFPVILRSEGNKAPMDLCGKDFSPQGLFVLCTIPPALGSLFQIEFDLSPMGGTVTADVRVVRTVTSKEVEDDSQWGAGVEFVQIREEDRASLEDWVQRLRKFEEQESIPMPPPSEPPPDLESVESLFSALEGGEEDGPSKAAPAEEEATDTKEPPQPDLEIRVQLEGFDYLTRHHEVKMTTQGIFIRTDSPLPTGSRVTLELDSKSEGEIYRAKGQVMRLVTTRLPETASIIPGMSIRITACSDATRAFLQRLMKKTAEASF